MREQAASQPSSIVVVRALRGLGDILCFVPAARALRAAFPEARVSLLGLPEAAPVVERFPAYFDELLEFPGFPGIPERPGRPDPALLAQLRRRHFGVALQAHGDGSVVNRFIALLDATRSYGFHPADGPCPDPRRFVPYPAEAPEVARNLALVRLLGVRADDTRLEFPVLGTDVRELDGIGMRLAPGSYAVVHPGGHRTWNRWPPRRFAEVADGLAEAGLAIVLTGSGGEAGLAREVAGAMRSPAIDLSGRTTLGSLAALVRDARLLLGNDTGVAHLADALDTPSVVVFTDADPGRWGPLDRDRHRVVVSPPARPAPVAAVRAEVSALLEREGVHVA